MEPFLAARFDALLAEATGNFTERIVHRCGGPEAALAQLSDDPEGEGVRRSEFVATFFAENLLDNPGGHCFVLEALSRRTVAADSGGPVSQVLARLATAAFADVLTRQTSQLIQRQQFYS